MKRRSFHAVMLGAAGSLAASAAAVPRKSIEFAVQMPQGGEIPLTQYRGKVLIVEFLITTCPHCQHAAQLLTKMQAEYGPKGFQAIGVSFDPMPRLVVPDFVQSLGLRHPVGYSTREKVYEFLDADLNYAIHVPQLVFVDKQGVVRHQSKPREDAETGKEETVRAWIEKLLKEPKRPT
jgi:peroxiredoxin